MSIPRRQRVCGLIIVALLIAGASGCNSKIVQAEPAKSTDAADSDEALSVRAEAAQLRTIKETVVAMGRCEALPDRVACLTPAMEGQVESLLAKVGDTVKQNQPIVQLDAHMAQTNLVEKTATRDGLNATLQLLQAPPRAEELKMQESAVEQAKLAFEKTQAAVDRLRPLLEKQQIPPAQVYEAELAASQAKLQRESTEAQLQSMKLGPRPEAIAEAKLHLATADATLDSARVQLNASTLKSPIEGVLDSLTCRMGQTLSPGAAIGEVVDLRQLVVVLWLPAQAGARESRTSRRGCGRGAVSPPRPRKPAPTMTMSQWKRPRWRGRLRSLVEWPTDKPGTSRYTFRSTTSTIDLPSARWCAPQLLSTKKPTCWRCRWRGWSMSARATC